MARDTAVTSDLASVRTHRLLSSLYSTLVVYWPKRIMLRGLPGSCLGENSWSIVLIEHSPRSLRSSRLPCCYVFIFVVHMLTNRNNQLPEKRSGLVGAWAAHVFVSTLPFKPGLLPGELSQTQHAIGALAIVFVRRLPVVRLAPVF